MTENEFNSKLLPSCQRLYNLCYRILGNREDANDALQDVIVKLWTTRSSLGNVKSFDAYVSIITRNHCLDRLRVRKITLGEDYFGSNEESNSDGEEEKNKRLKAIHKALRLLNDQQQQVFTMRDIEGMEFDDIAKVLGISAEGVRVTLSRARKSIRQYISDKGLLI